MTGELNGLRFYWKTAPRFPFGLLGALAKQIKTFVPVFINWTEMVQPTILLYVFGPEQCYLDSLAFISSCETRALFRALTLRRLFQQRF